MNERGMEDVINTLYEMIQEARGVPFSSEKCVIDRESALDLLDEMINQLPGELKQAKTIVESRGEVINNAKREAENILKQAQNQARQMVSESEIMAQAHADAEAMLQQAHDDSEAMVQKAQARIKELKKVTTDFVDEALRNTEQSIFEALTGVRETRSKFNAVVGVQTKNENPAIIEEID